MTNIRIPKPLLTLVAASALPCAVITTAAAAHDGHKEAQIALIPDRFHGTWDAAESDCSPNSDARLKITAAEMVFYESMGAVTRVKQDNEGALITVLVSSEGETFETTYRLYVRDDRLFMEVAGTNYGAFERKRCS